MTTFEDGTGSGPKSAQKLRRRRSEPGPVVPRACLSCALRCNCTQQVRARDRFPECYRAPEEATK